MVTATDPIPLQLLIRILKISDGKCAMSCKTIPRELLCRRLYDRVVDKHIKQCQEEYRSVRYFNDVNINYKVRGLEL